MTGPPRPGGGGAASRPGNGSGGRRSGRGNRRYAAGSAGSGGAGGKRGWRKLLTWKALALSALGTFLLGMIGVAVAFAMTPVPEANDFANTQATIVYWNDGETELGRFSSENRESVHISDIPLHVQQAVIAAEDRSFYENKGFDPVGIARAGWNSLRGGEIRGGGSTITQQYVKNYYLTHAKTLSRKIKELFISVKLDQQLSKDQILEDYLNTIWFDRGTYGVETASKSYFGKPVAELSLEEGAGLAALIRLPKIYDPTLGGDNVTRFEERFRYVLAGMVEAGAIDQSTADAAVVPEVKELKKGDQLGGPNGYLIEQVKKELLAAGLDGSEIDGGGLRVVTTFDRTAQAAAVEAVQAHFPDTEAAENLHVGMAAVIPGDGGVVAMYGGPDFVTQGRNDALSKLQPGSTAKPFGLIALLEDGVSLESRFQGDSPIEDPRLGSRGFVDNQGDTDYGEVDLVKATERSINTAFVDMTLQHGYEMMQDALVRAGVPAESPGMDIAEYRTLLGIFSASPMEMAQAYATIAAGGKHADWYTVKRVTAPSGEVRHEVDPDPQQVFEPGVIADATYAMTQVVEGERGTGFAARELGRPSAGKTGTHEEVTSWYAGFTPQIAATVMFYNDDGGTESSLRGIVDGGSADDPFPGGGVPARTWTAFMKAALEDEPVIDFPGRADVGEPINPTPTAPPTCPPGTEGTPPDCQTPEPTATPTCPPGTEGEFPACAPIPPPETEDPEVQVPQLRGLTEEEATLVLRGLGFEWEVVHEESDREGPGLVFGQDPRPGQMAPVGSTVTIYIATEPTPPPTTEPPECDPEVDPECDQDGDGTEGASTQGGVLGRLLDD